MIFRISYNPETTLVTGNYSSDLKYKNIIIDEENKTINNEPYIEISSEEHTANLGKKMCVVDGVYQEYIKPLFALLQEAKTKKLVELKAIRNSSDEAPLRGIQAYEVTLDETFSKTKTNNLVFFHFDTKPVDTPVRNPLAILARVYRKGHNDPNYYLPYKCDIENGDNTTRKGIVALTYDIAQTVENHMEARGSTNSVFKSYYETLINNCSTIEEVEAVNFGLNDNESRLVA